MAPIDSSELEPPAVAEAPEQIDRATLRDPVAQAHLERFGFAVVPLLDGDSLERVRQAYDRLGPAPDDPQVSINWSFHSRSAEYKQSVKHTMLPLAQTQLDRVLVDHTVYLTTFITKWPGDNGAFAPHQDPSLVDERRFRGVTIWIPLEDAGPVEGADNGMLWVVPGSHRFSRALRLPDVDRFQFAEHERAIIERHAVGVPTKAGDALIFDNRVLHHSMPNETDRARVVLSFGVRPSEGACVHLRDRGDGTLDLYEIDDDFYIDVLPAKQHEWSSPLPPIARLREVTHRWSPDEFALLCDAVGPVGCATIAPGDHLRWRDPGVFCALCGATDDLDQEIRVGRNNAQLVCSSCRATLVSPPA